MNHPVTGNTTPTEAAEFLLQNIMERDTQ